MPGGLDATTCGACGAHLAREQDAREINSCPRCSAPLTGLRVTTETLLTGTVPAAVGSRGAARAVDIGVVLAAMFPGVAIGTLPGATAFGPVLGLTCALIAGAMLLRAFRTTGRTPGASIARLRYVDAFAGTAPGPGRWPWQQVHAVDLGGRDPLVAVGLPTTPVAVPLPGPEPTTAAPRTPEPLVPVHRTPPPRPTPEPAPAPPEPSPPTRPAPQRPTPPASAPQPQAPRTPTPPEPRPTASDPTARSATPQVPTPTPDPRPAAPAPPDPAASPSLTPTPPPVTPSPAFSGCYLLSGPARVQVTGTVLVGRNPRPKPGEQVDAVVPFGDFDLSISTTHAHLEWDGEICWVSDRGSTNGTSVTTTEGTWRIPPGAQAPARPGDTVHLGSRPFTVVVA